MNDEIKTFLLVNGMEILARVRERMSDGSVVIDHPAIPQITPSGNLGFVPAVMTAQSETSLTISADKIVSEVEPRTDIAEAYAQHISPIVQPQKSIITG